MGVLWHAGLDGRPACRVLRAHDCVRLKKPNALRDGRQRESKKDPIDEGAHALILFGRVKFAKWVLTLLLRRRFFWSQVNMLTTALNIS